MKNIFLFFIIILFICMTTSSIYAQSNEFYVPPPPEEELGKVIKVLDESIDTSLEAFGTEQKVQKIKVKVLTGKLKDQEHLTENRLSGNPAFDINLKEGDRVLLHIESLPEDKKEINISNYYRFPVLAILFSIFTLLILVIGGNKGLRSLIGLAFTYFLIFYFLIPSILNGYSPLLITIIICSIATCFTIFIISGLNLKSLSAIIGTVSGVSAAGIIALLTIKYAPLSGTPGEEAIALWASDSSLNFKGILASAMIIGALGASMDVGISIASSIFEVKKADPEATTSYLIKSGMNVGKDIMGTMTNTLLLAYTGSALFLLLLAYNNVSFTKLINLDSIVSEITAALAGSIGLILCIPITAFVASNLFNIKKPKSYIKEK